MAYLSRKNPNVFFRSAPVARIGCELKGNMNGFGANPLRAPLRDNYLNGF